MRLNCGGIINGRPSVLEDIAAVAGAVKANVCWTLMVAFETSLAEVRPCLAASRLFGITTHGSEVPLLVLLFSSFNRQLKATYYSPPMSDRPYTPPPRLHSVLVHHRCPTDRTHHHHVYIVYWYTKKIKGSLCTRGVYSTTVQTAAGEARREISPSFRDETVCLSSYRGRYVTYT